MSETISDEELAEMKSYLTSPTMVLSPEQCRRLLREVERLQAERRPKPPEGDFWWCPKCQDWVPWAHVRYDETHDACGCLVLAEDPRGEVVRITQERDALKARVAELEGVNSAANALVAYLKSKHPDIESSGYTCPYMKALADAIDQAKGAGQ